jgi:propionyl-CoA carboxylase alpha chain
VITSLLVANRGEIARRVFRTCRAAGIGTVAVFSDPDANAPHVAEADRAVRLPGASAAQTYLNGESLVAAALAAGADAVHPGYGFLSEDPGFARQVLDAGLCWVGPPPQAMHAMALKIEARKRAASAGVPVLPELDPESVLSFPVLVKASAGGGGRGMRAVFDGTELDAAIESARREAAAAFGDGTVFCEPLLTGARHIEVQVLADDFGTVWALTERDCSVQRRYAKVIEETPSPAVGAELRERLLAAATALARDVGYRGAGTVEFLVGGSGQQQDFYFLEFNTRLQVEHPVTECLHGIDLVALQIAVAEGRALPEQPPAAAGHAVEARLYAEDPVAGFRPASGPVLAFDVPGTDATFGLPPDLARPFLRVDSGVAAGTEVSTHYDAMLAKLIAWAPSRDEAIRRLAAGLASATIAGPPTNRDLLVSVLRDRVFTSGDADTSLLEGYDYAALVPDQRACALSAAAAAVAVAAANRRDARAAATIPGGWRNLPSLPQVTAFDSPHGRLEVRYRWATAGIAIEDLGEVGVGIPAVIAFAPERVTLEIAGVCHGFGITRDGERIWIGSSFGSVGLTLLDRLPVPVRAIEPGSLVAPMPGNVTRLAAAAGDQVLAGQLVLVIEAMKMEHQITAPSAGLLTELRVGAGAQVNAGDVLAIVTVAEAERD